MKLRLTFLLSFIFIAFSSAQDITLSANAEVSVITVGPGQSLNDAFGHNAFRIKDDNLGIDVVYGYGEYDFDSPNFYLKFAQGKLNYLISRHTYNSFYRYYSSHDRSVQEQILNFDIKEKQALFSFLQNNYRPENRQYLYDFFYDNCATRMRDVVEQVTERKVTFSTPENFEQKTFRGLIHEHVDRNSWGSFGIDLALGSIIDREATPYEYMYLPKYIFEFFGNANLDSGKKLVSETRMLYSKKTDTSLNRFLTSPLMIIGLVALFIIFITYRDFKKNKRSSWLDIVLFAFTGITGVFMLALWFATDHTATAYNYNLLWAFPLNLFVIAQVFKSKVKVWFIKYLKFLIIMLCLLSLHWLLGVQIYAIGILPLLLALMIRYLYLLKYFRQL